MSSAVSLKVQGIKTCPADMETPPVTEDGSMMMSDSNAFELDESILAAQREADEIADQQERDDAEKEKGTSNNNNKVDEDAPLPAMPKLLALPQQDLVNKTKDMQQRGAQLDLLLLKAESYSKFIAENQKRSKLVGMEAAATNTTKGTPSSSSDKRRGSGSGSKQRKSPKGRSSDSPSSSNHQHPEETGAGIPSSPLPSQSSQSHFAQPPSLTGGTLKGYQLEGLYVFCSMFFLFLFVSLYLSLDLLLPACLHSAFSDTTTWHESNHHCPLNQSINQSIINGHDTHITDHRRTGNGCCHCGRTV
jgi:hypothetical protein